MTRRSCTCKRKGNDRKIQVKKGTKKKRGKELDPLESGSTSTFETENEVVYKVSWRMGNDE